MDYKKRTMNRHQMYSKWTLTELDSKWTLIIKGL